MDDFDKYYEPDLTNDKIPDELIAVCVVNATLRTPGVASLSGGITNYISKTVRKKEILSKGVKIDKTEEGLVIDVYLKVKYGVKIPVVAWDVQNNVKKEVEGIASRNISAVNIHVQGVKFTETNSEGNNGQNKS